MLLEQITLLIGDIPFGFEPLVYVLAVLVLLYLTDCFYGVIRILCNHFLRR